MKWTHEYNRGNGVWDIVDANDEIIAQFASEKDAILVCRLVNQDRMDSAVQPRTKGISFLGRDGWMTYGALTPEELEDFKRATNRIEYEMPGDWVDFDYPDELDGLLDEYVVRRDKRLHNELWAMLDECVARHDSQPDDSSFEAQYNAQPKRGGKPLLSPALVDRALRALELREQELRDSHTVDDESQGIREQAGGDTIPSRDNRTAPDDDESQDAARYLGVDDDLPF